MSDPVLRVERVSKRYGDVRALRDVSIEFLAGEVHAVLGENGAGKSTLMSVLAGFVVPDSGEVGLSHESRAVSHGPYPFGRPHEIRRMGIEMVHQHFMLVREFTVAENFALGTLRDLRGPLDTVASERRLQEVAKGLGWEVDVRAKTRSLPVGVQQRLEIMRALAGDARVLILDEPTAVLSPHEVEDLLRVLRRLRDEGKCVILIAHKLSEVLSVSDRVSVLRHGELVATAERSAVDERQLAKWMVGEIPPNRTPLAPSYAAPLVSVSHLVVRGSRGETAVRGVTFDIRPGEVLGIGGVDGNGQIELAEALAVFRQPDSGSIDWTGGRGPTGYIPQDRHEQGLALGMTVTENLLIGEPGEVWAGAFLKRKKLGEHARRLIEQFEIKVGDEGDQVRSLSGGNQQKLVVSRVLDAQPDLLIAHNPTRGLDVRATAFVQDRIIEAARNGAAVVLFSTDLDELSAVASRTLFMKRGELFEGGAEALVG